MSGYRPVRVTEDELIHYARTGAKHTIGCEQPIIAELPATGDEVRAEQPRCGPCVLPWMAAIGRIRLVQRHHTLLIRPTTDKSAVTGHRPATR